MMTVEEILPWAQIAAAIGAPLLIAWATKSSAADATREAHELDYDRRRKAEAAELDTVLRGIQVEVATVVQRYLQAAGRELKEAADAGDFFRGYLMAEQSYFTIYDHAAGVLGRLADRELHASIVRTYTLLRAMIDAQRIQRENFQSTHGFTRIRDAGPLRAHTEHLADTHNEMIDSVRDTLQRLEAYYGPLDTGGSSELCALSEQR